MLGAVPRRESESCSHDPERLANEVHDGRDVVQRASRTVSRLIRSDRYTIRGFVSTAIKHGLNPMTTLRDTLLGQPWMPDPPATT
jgi:hypothetical protein